MWKGVLLLDTRRYLKVKSWQGDKGLHLLGERINPFWNWPISLLLEQIDINQNLALCIRLAVYRLYRQHHFKSRGHGFKNKLELIGRHYFLEYFLG